ESRRGVRGRSRGRPPGVFEAESNVFGAVTSGPGSGDGRGEELKIDVPDPGDVATVGEAVVEKEGDSAGSLEGGEKLEHLVGASRILAEHDAEAAPVELDHFLAAEGGAGGREPPTDG